MQNIEYIYHKGKKIRFSFNFTHIDKVGDTLEEFLQHFGSLFVRIEQENRVFIMQRKSKTCMKAISVSQQIVQDEVLAGLKIRHCTLPLVYKAELIGDRIEFTCLRDDLEDGTSDFEKKLERRKNKK